VLRPLFPGRARARGPLLCHGLYSFDNAQKETTFVRVARALEAHIGLLYVPQKTFRHSGPRLYPIIKSVGHKTPSMRCSLFHRNGVVLLRRYGFRRNYLGLGAVLGALGEDMQGQTSLITHNPQSRRVAIGELKSAGPS
jgi:hypothetical protein